MDRADLKDRRILYAAEEGDPLLFSDGNRMRQNPLRVTRREETEDGRRTITVEGPREAEYIIVERQDGTLRFADSYKEITKLQFSNVNDSATRRFEQVVEEVADDALELYASDNYDYDEGEVTLHDAALTWVREANPMELTRFLLGGNREADIDLDAFESAPGQFSVTGKLAYATLIAECRERVGAFTDVAGPDASMDKDDVEQLVDTGVTILASAVSEKGEDDIEDMTYVIAEDLLDDLGTADHVQLLELTAGTGRGKPIPYGDREAVADRAIGRLQVEILDEYSERWRDRLEADEVEVKTLEELVEEDDAEEAAEEADDDEPDLPAADTTEQIRDAVVPERMPNVPLMKDGGAPHTALDEALLAYGQPIIVTAGDWQLTDPGVVFDADGRKLIWENADDEMVVVAGVNEGDYNKWKTSVFGRTTSEVVYEGRSFEEAYAAVESVIVGRDGDGPTVSAFQNAVTGQIRVASNVDEVGLGQSVLLRSGPDAFPRPIRASVGALNRVGTKHKGPLGLVGRPTIGAARTATYVGKKGVFEPTEWVVRRIWRTYGKEIGDALVKTISLAAIAQIGRVIASSQAGLRVNAEDEEAEVFASGTLYGGEFEFREPLPTLVPEAKRVISLVMDVDKEDAGEALLHLMRNRPNEFNISAQDRDRMIRELEDEVEDDSSSGSKGGGSSSRSDGGKTTPKTNDDDDDLPSVEEVKKNLSSYTPKQIAQVFNVPTGEANRMKQTGEIKSARPRKLYNQMQSGMSLGEVVAQLDDDDKDPQSPVEIAEMVADADRGDQMEMPANETDVSPEDAKDDVSPEQRGELAEEAIDNLRDYDPDQDDANETLNRYSGEMSTDEFDFGAEVERARRMQQERATRQEEEQWAMEEKRLAEEREEAMEWAEGESFYDDFEDY